MKSQSIYASLLLCILTFTRFLTIAAELCIDFPNPLDHSEKVIVECPTTANTDTDVKRQTINFFQVTHNCTVNVALCNKVKIAFIDAGVEISKVLNLKQIIKVYVFFTDFNDINILGSAGSARKIPLISDDKIIRFYPQALVKQFSLDPHPEYSDLDIIAHFNAGQEWWFRNDNVAIEPEQIDFNELILHELIHGLGFESSWNDDLEYLDRQKTTGLTPDFLFHSNEFLGFYEYIFDRYVNFLSSSSVVSTSTSYTYQLNMAVAKKTSFNTYSDFVTEVKSSSQWKYAESALIHAITNYSLYFAPAKYTSSNKGVYLESGLYPFARGSSISHVSIIYEKTPDFLMTWKQDPGETLEETIQFVNYTSPIGPGILSILESIGYETDNSPNPIKPTYIHE
ncbi:hypothetical protein Glove_85g154 [Diversispora epigaea]|uniref:Sequence orphan n=1 Tax=Diversispora epigaea TaxID=1348612 RepID=A0A397J9A0_9GLOM|nr:hypothetical protein Glove_85g154 [Diversispora epigaea]